MGYNPEIIGRWDSHFALWTAGFQWSVQTLTSIGYGDVLPVNKEEHIMNVFLMMVLAMVWVRTLGTMTAYMTTLIGTNLKLYETMDELNYIMNEHNLPKPLQTQLRLYFRKARLTDTMRFFGLIGEMSPFLRNQVVKYANAMWIDDCFFLKEAGDAFMGDLALTFKMELLSMGERFGVLRTFYIINNGLVARRGRVMRRAGVFGEDVVLQCEELCEDPSVFSLIYTEVLKMSHYDLYEVLDHEEYGAERVMIRRWAVRIAVIRGIIQEAKRRLDSPGVNHGWMNFGSSGPASSPVMKTGRPVLMEHEKADIFSDLQGVQDRLGKVHQTLGALTDKRGH